MKKVKGLKQAHTPNSKYPKSDSYGTGIRNKIGRTLDSSMNIKSALSKHLKSPPKSLA